MDDTSDLTDALAASLADASIPPSPTLVPAPEDDASLPDPTTETLDELITRHKHELRDLTAKVTGLKKTATKGDKKKKKEVATEVALLEQELGKRHERELAELEAKVKAAKGAADGSADGKDEEGEEDLADDGIMLDRLNELSREEVPLAPPSTPITGPKGKKTNRQKQRKAVKAARMEEMREQAGQEASEQVDMRKIEDEAIAELLVSMKLSLKEVNADGHCLYNAISDQLVTRHGSKTNHQILRNNAATYMRKHPAEFIPFLSKDDGEMYSLEEFQQYCDKIENTATWGGQLEILALSKTHEVPVYVVQMGSPVLKISEDEFTGKEPVKISYHRHMFGLGAHYNSLRDA